ncbi:MAG: hypothetical protein GF350_10495 [Chitinivibrionales bacterium]|nr:hypothetical protein [Chitinivibrionales bacterium]
MKCCCSGILWCALSVACLLCRCSSGVVATETGTGSEVVVLDGTVVHPDGTGAAHAAVRLRRQSFLDTAVSPPGEYRNGITDSDGHFILDSVFQGDYYIEIANSAARADSALLIPCMIRISDVLSGSCVITQDSTSGNILIECDTGSHNRTVTLPRDTLLPAGAVTGRINLPMSDNSLRPLVVIYGLEHSVVADVNQRFRFSGLPAGTYALRIIQDPETYLTLTGITVESGQTTDLGILNLPIIGFFSGCRTGACDSAALHSILKANGLDTIQHETIARRDPVSNRIVALDLQGLGLTELTGNIGSLSSCSELILRDNSLTELPTEIGFLYSLTTLDANSNLIARLPTEIGNLDSLKYFSLNTNRIAHLPREIGKLNITRLDIGNNSLTGLPPDIQNLSNLEVCILDKNEFSRYPAEVNSLTGLFYLSLAGNMINSIPASIGNLTRLTHLDFSTNFIAGLPPEIGQCDSLVELYCSDNLLSALPVELSSISSMQLLDLSGNRLDSLPDNIGNLSSLQYLSLYANRLTWLPSSITALTNLDHLSLAYNKLCTLPADIIIWADTFNEGWASSQLCTIE